MDNYNLKNAETKIDAASTIIGESCLPQSSKDTIMSHLATAASSLGAADYIISDAYRSLDSIKLAISELDINSSEERKDNAIIEIARVLGLSSPFLVRFDGDMSKLEDLYSRAQDMIDELRGFSNDVDDLMSIIDEYHNGDDYCDENDIANKLNDFESEWSSTIDMFS